MASIRLQFAGEDIEQCRLSRAVRTNDGEELPLRDRQIDAAQSAVFQRGAFVEGDFDILDPNHLPARLARFEKENLRPGANKAIATRTAVTTFTSDAVRPMASELSASAIASR